MAMKQLGPLSTQLAEAGVTQDHPVTVATNVSLPSFRTLKTTVATMKQDCTAANICNPAVVILHLPREKARSGTDRHIDQPTVSAVA